MISAYLGGLAPGLLATVFAALGAKYLLIPTVGSFQFADGFSFLYWCLFLLAGVGMSAFSEAMHRTQTRLRFQLDVTERIMDSAAVSITVLDSKANIRFINPEMQKVFGFSPDELRGQPLHEKIHHHYPDGRPYPAAECPFVRIFDTGKALRGHEDLFFHKDGTQIPVLCSNAAILDDEEVVGAVFVVHDITERKRADARLNEAIVARDKLLAFVSHDLKNPISAIDLYSVLLIKHIEAGCTSEFVSKNVQRIRESATRMSRLISDLLDVSSIDAGHFNFEPSVVRVGDVLRKVIEDTRPLAEVKGIHLEESLTGEAEEMVCDPDRIAQIFANLIGNAIKFTDEKDGIVRISCWLSDDWITFAVGDNGPGILPEEVPYIFDRFWHSGRSRKAGTGLGLAIADGIVKAHQGKIWVESKVGKGSTFYFTIPRSSSAIGKALLQRRETSRLAG